MANKKFDLSSMLSGTGRSFSPFLVTPKYFNTTFKVSDFNVHRPSTTFDLMAEEELEKLAKKLGKLALPAPNDIRIQKLGELLGEKPIVTDVDDMTLSELLNNKVITSAEKNALDTLGIFTLGDAKYFRHYRSAKFLTSDSGKSALANNSERATELIDRNVIGNINPANIDTQTIEILKGIGSKGLSKYSNAPLNISTLKEFADADLFKRLSDYKGGMRPSGPMPGSINISRPTTSPMQAELVKDKSALISEVTQKINSSPLDFTDKFVLSFEPVYVYVLYKAIVGDGVKDASGIFSRIFSDGVGKVREYINKKLLDRVIEAERIDLNGFQKDDLAERIGNNAMSYTRGQVQKSVLAVINGIDSFGDLEKLVNQFFLDGDIKVATNEKQRIKSIMINYLAEIGLNIGHVNGNAALLTQKFDEYLASAYIFAIKNKGASDDPVKRIFSGGINTFNYEVNYFDSIETQSIDVENILAAGTLYYIKVLGDEMGLFRIMDSLIMAWTSGRIDVPQGPTATRMYNYYKLREDRTTAQERAMFYKIVLNSGEGQVMDGMSVNRNFSAIWGQLMEETVRYIKRYEDSDKSNQVSKSNIIQSIKFLQQNLSRHAFGMVKAIIPEVYAHLEEAIEILNSPEIISQLGRGYYDRNSETNNRNLWDVVERMSMEEFGQIPNTSAMITSAVKGHQIFRGIADFSEGTFLDSQFREFVDNCESFIIASSQGSGENHQSDHYQEEDREEMAMEPMEEEWDF